MLPTNFETVNKIIYAKRFKTTKEQMQGILELEVKNHLRNRPDLEFVRLGDVTENNDLSKTFPLIFRKKAVNTPAIQSQPQKAATEIPEEKLSVEA